MPVRLCPSSKRRQSLSPRCRWAAADFQALGVVYIPKEDKERGAKMQNEKMKRFDLYIGCYVNGKEKHTRTDVCAIVGQTLMDNGFDGCTFAETIGMWEGVNEPGVICTICTDRKQKDIYSVVGLIRDRLQQESILVMESEPKIAFI